MRDMQADQAGLLISHQGAALSNTNRTLCNEYGLCVSPGRVNPTVDGGEAQGGYRQARPGRILQIDGPGGGKGAAGPCKPGPSGILQQQLDHPGRHAVSAEAEQFRIGRVNEAVQLIQKLSALLGEHLDKAPLLSQAGESILLLVAHFFRMRNQVFGHAVCTDLIGLDAL